MIFYLMMDKGLVQGLGSEAGYPSGVHAQNAIWLQVSIAAEFLIFAARAPGLFFFSRPSTELMFSTMLGNVAATLLAIYAFDEPLDWEEVATIWMYDLVVLFIVDFTKMIYKYLAEHGGAGIIDEAAIAEEDAKMSKPADENMPVVEFDATVERHRASVRLIATEATRKSRSTALSKSFIATGGTGDRNSGKARKSRNSKAFAGGAGAGGGGRNRDSLLKRTP